MLPTYPCATLCGYQNTLMHKSELKTYLSLINHVIKEYKLKAGTIETHRSIGFLIIKFWNWLNISQYRVNYTLVPYVNYNKTPSDQVYDLLSTTCKLSWTDVRNLTRQCYHLSRLSFKSLSYNSHLLCDQMTYSISKEHMSNSIKWITMATDFMITCSLDHPRGHTVSIPWDIMVPLLRIHVATCLHQ